MSIRVVVADDHPIFREGLVRSLVLRTTSGGGACATPDVREFIFDDLSFVDEPACPPDTSINDGGFESVTVGRSAWQLVLGTNNTVGQVFATIPNAEYALELSRAYNRWLVAEWLREEPGLFGAVLACPQDPVASAREIAEYAREEKIVAVFLPTAGVNPLWGHRRYDPILAAAQEADLPVVLHSVTVITPSLAKPASASPASMSTPASR